MVDRYTRIVLTVIAAALVALVVQNGLKGAFAQQDTGCGNTGLGQPVCVVAWTSPMPVYALITRP
jgi:hypothetical protein